MEILVWKAKHGDMYFDASTPEKKESAALSILAHLSEIGYFQMPEKPSDDRFDDDFMELVNMPMNKAKSLPEKFQGDVAKAKRLYESRNAEYNEEMSFFTIARALLNGEKVAYNRGWQGGRNS